MCQDLQRPHCCSAWGGLGSSELLSPPGTRGHITGCRVLENHSWLPDSAAALKTFILVLLLRVIVASLSSLSRTGGLFLWCLGRFPLKSYFSQLKEEEGTGRFLKPHSLRIYSHQCCKVWNSYSGILLPFWSNYSFLVSQLWSRRCCPIKEEYIQEKIETQRGGSQVLFTAPGFIHFVLRQVLQELAMAWKDENKHGLVSGQCSS